MSVPFHLLLLLFSYIGRVEQGFSSLHRLQCLCLLLKVSEYVVNAMAKTEDHDDLRDKIDECAAASHQYVAVDSICVPKEVVEKAHDLELVDCKKEYAHLSQR